MVDAVNGLSTLAQFAEARRQIIVADRIILTKTDISDADAGTLKSELRRLNPRAAVEIARGGLCDPTVSLGEPTDGDRGAGFVAEAVHSDGIGSFVWREDQPVDFDAFARAMETLVALRGTDLLRVKGLLNVTGCKGPVVVQFVQHLAHPPVELEGWPDGDRSSRVVFITRGVSEGDVRALFAAVRTLAKR